MWDQRYDRPDYLFGTKPAAFLAQHGARIPQASRILCVADGEGRNSVHLAKLGHEVTAFDASEVGVEKAQRLAADNSVRVNFTVSDVDDWDWSLQFDVVIGIFIQFADPDLRARLFRQMVNATRPGGLLFLHGYAPRQVEYGTGGPPQVSHMYTKELLREAFSDLDLIHLDDYDREIDEGVGHSGLSGLVDLIAIKPA